MYCIYQIGTVHTARTIRLQYNPIMYRTLLLYFIFYFIVRKKKIKTQTNTTFPKKIVKQREIRFAPAINARFLLSQRLTPDRVLIAGAPCRI